MDLGALLLILSVTLLVGLFLAQPFMERTARRVSAEEREYSELMAERDRIVAALEELEFDHALGKVTDEDFRAQRALLLQRGAEVLRQLDALTETQSAVSAEERLAAEVARRRADARVEKPARRMVYEDDDLEALLAQRRRQRKERAAGFCPKCGSAVLASDRFCPRCGHALK